MRISYLSEFSKFCSFGETNGGLLRYTAIGSTEDLKSQIDTLVQKLCELTEEEI